MEATENVSYKKQRLNFVRKKKETEMQRRLHKWWTDTEATIFWGDSLKTQSLLSTAAMRYKTYTTEGSECHKYLQTIMFPQFKPKQFRICFQIFKKFTFIWWLIKTCKNSVTLTKRVLTLHFERPSRVFSVWVMPVAPPPTFSLYDNHVFFNLLNWELLS